MHMLNKQGQGGRIHVHGFDFFKEIDGKIHYMEDGHDSLKHCASEEERICLELARQRRVSFVT